MVRDAGICLGHKIVAVEAVKQRRVFCKAISAQNFFRRSAIMACRMVDATRATIIRQTAFCGNTGTAEKSNVVLRRSKTENSYIFRAKSVIKAPPRILAVRSPHANDRHRYRHSVRYARSGGSGVNDTAFFHNADNAHDRESRWGEQRHLQV